VKIIAAWGAVAAWMALVWWLGSNDFAASRTSPWLESLIYWLFPDLPRAGHLALSITIRKLAHPTVYGVLAGPPSPSRSESPCSTKRARQGFHRERDPRWT
jgi:hypothetical protein